MNRMMKVSLCAVSATIALSGCESMDKKTASAGVGAAIGCAVGALVAKGTKGDAAKGCGIGAVAGGLAGYLKARQDELKAAREAAAAVASVPGASAGAVQTQVVQVTDQATGKVEAVETFKALSVDVPLSQLNTPNGQAVMTKLDTYAKRVADERANTVAMDVSKAPVIEPPPKDVEVLSTRTEKSGNGQVQRRQLNDARVPKPLQRVTIEANQPDKLAV
jgi:hypothetical protein